MMSAWTKHKSPPFTEFVPSIVSIQNNEVLVIQEKSEKLIKGKGIWKYTNKGKKWEKVMEYSQDFIIDGLSVTIDSETRLIYGCNGSRLLEIDANNSKINIMSEIIGGGVYPTIFCEKDKVHVVGNGFGDQTNAEYKIFDKQTNTFQIVYSKDMTIPLPLSTRSAIMKRRQSMITTAITDFDNYTNKYAYTIVEYSFVDNKWVDWKVKGIYFSSQIVSTENEHYLIFLGGMGDVEETGFLDHISIFDMRNKTLMKTSITTPCSYFEAIMLGDVAHDELLVFGYINKLWKLE
eukprot:2596_1